MSLRKKTLKYDVVVAGGGTSGFAAAIAAAKAGQKTLIIESNAFLGGMATGGMISQLMGFVEGEQEPLTGVVGDMLTRLKKKNACTDIQTIYLAGRKEANVSAVSYDADVLKYIMDCMVAEAGADVFFHSTITNIIMQDNKIHALNAICGDEQITVEAEIFIDASFHGVLASMTGMSLQQDCSPNQYQPASLMFKMANVDGARFAALSPKEKEALVKSGIDEGSLFVDNILARPLGEAGIYYHNMSRLSADVSDVQTWSKSEKIGREQVHKISNFLIKHVPGFEHATLSSTGAFLGLRDSNRFKGKYTLTGEDIEEGKYFPDAIAACSFPIDIHSKQYGYTFIKPKNGVFYVPYDSMVGSIDNLILTGRIISADKAAHGCLRVMICCMRLGEAAGKAAKISQTKKIPVNQVDGKEIGLC